MGPRVLDTVPDAAAWWRAITRRWIHRVLRSDDFRQPLQEYAVERACLQGVHLPERRKGRTTQVSTATPPQGTTATPPSTATPLQGGTSMKRAMLEWS